MDEYTPRGLFFSADDCAGVGIRFVAMLIDGFVMSVMNGVLMFGLGAAAFSNLSRQDLEHVLSTLFGGTLLACLLSMVFAVLYVVLTTAYWGGTPGKLLVGLRVVDDQGRKIGVGTSLVRYLVWQFISPFFYLGFLWAFFDEYKQTWHDKLAGTYVVSTEFLDNPHPVYPNPNATWDRPRYDDLEVCPPAPGTSRGLGRWEDDHPESAASGRVYRATLFGGDGGKAVITGGWSRLDVVLLIVAGVLALALIVVLVLTLAS